MKKFTTICMAFVLMLMVVLTGCSTFSIDKVKYYNEIVAKVGDQNITRFELVNAYNNYGYTNFVTQEGQTEKEALLSTANLLVERKMLVQYAKDNLSKYSLSEYEINNLLTNTIDYLHQSFEDNLTTARKIYGLKEVASSVEEEESPTSQIKLSDYKYQKRVQIKDGNISYIDIDTDGEIIDYALDSSYITNFYNRSEKEIINAIYDKFIEEFYYNENNEDEELFKKVCDKAIELSCNNLINYEYYLREDGKRLSTNQKDVLIRYIERTFTSELESAYISKVSNVYMQEEQLSNESIINAYKALYESDYARYNKDIDAYNDSIITTGSAESELIYYNPNSNAKFGYFLHVLLPFNNMENDLNWLKDHKMMYTDEEYQALQLEYINQITCQQRTIKEEYVDDTLVYEEGIVLDEQVAIKDVLQEYNSKVTDLNSFVEFMFKYSTDTATLNADMPYVIGYNTITDETYTTMVESFTNEAVRLMKSNQKYTMANEYIISSYGVHLLYYVAPLVNQIEYSSLSNVTVQQLDSAILNPATGETYLDRIFDLVYPASSSGMFSSNTKYSDFETILVESLYSKYQVVLYETKIKASNKI